ncbi:choice-of-anchor R domain-containing protein [Candidatus Poriferisocius sp.]|uniref:choice-of-anchor R domain-containing protein n=1 Tax=Candidatus Poriferisocius sp. TaxID=3101276 RepID=UPI003B01EF0B
MKTETHQPRAYRRGRARRWASLLVAALVGLATVGVLDTKDAPPAAAQDLSSTLLSNLGKDTGLKRDTGSSVLAQSFTTGSATGGYALTSIELDVANSSVTEAQRDTVRVELWSDSSNSPGSKLASLKVPASISTGTTSFEAPPGTTLAKATTYHVVVYSVGNFALQINLTRLGGEDDGKAAGWSIGD